MDVRNEFDVISRMENILRDVEKFEKRLKKLNELAGRAKAEGRETRGYDLAKEEYEEKIRKIVSESETLLLPLEKRETNLKEERKRLEDEKLKKEAMYEIERELNEDQKEIGKLERDIQEIENKIKDYDIKLQKISSIKDKLKCYRRKEPCNHPRKIAKPVPGAKNMYAAVIYECPDCGAIWREQT
jgi:chromosome segregation ATPase